MQYITTGVESLSRRIALSGLMSRGEAERVIKQGLVAVDGKIVSSMQQVPDSSMVTVDGQLVPPPPTTPPLFGLIKPRGVVSDFAKAAKDKFFVSDLVNKWGSSDKSAQGPRGLADFSLSASSGISTNHMIVINKIPIMATGLLLLTTDGLLANALRNPNSKILTTYRLRLGNVTDSQIEGIRRWKNGIRVAGVDYGPVFVDIEKRTPTQTWLKVRLVDDGCKNLSDLFWFRAGLHVNRINCFAFGPYVAGSVPERQLVPLAIDPAIAHLVPKREIKPVLIRTFS